MREHAKFLPGALVALLLAGCAITVVDHWDRLGLSAAVSDAAAEINLHDATIDAAATLPEARAEVTRHRLAMEDHAAEIRGRAADMRCDLGGRDSMMNSVGALDARLADYLDEAAAAPTLTALRAACRAYAEDMHAIFERMDDRADAMGCRER